MLRYCILKSCILFSRAKTFLGGGICYIRIPKTHNTITPYTAGIRTVRKQGI
jgi:hypothetical protein